MLLEVPWYVIGLAVLFAPVQLLIHEFTHFLAGSVLGYVLDSVEFLRRIDTDGDGSKDQLLYGYVRMVPPHGRQVLPTEHAKILSAPLVYATCMTTVGLATIDLLDLTPLARNCIAVLVLAAWGDTAFNYGSLLVRSEPRHNDAWLLVEALGLPLRETRAAVVIFLAFWVVAMLLPS